jgi:hypothetical protein
MIPCPGALPDQLEFSKDCRTILVSNEGEPETYEPPSLENDPEGSVSVIDLVFCGDKEYEVFATQGGANGHNNGRSGRKMLKDDRWAGILA